MGEDKATAAPGNVVRIDEERIQGHLGRIVRGTVEDTPNALLDAEAGRLRNAKRYERTEARRGTRAGSYRRRPHTRAGEVPLRVPKLRRRASETAIIERYRRRETSVEEASVEEAPIEMHPAGRGVGAPGRGHHRSPAGHPGQPRHGEPLEPEDLRADRGVAEPPDPGHPPSRPPRRDRARAVDRGAIDGPARSGTCRCWWRSASRPKASGRSWASARARRRTRRAGRGSWPTSSSGASAASSRSRRTDACLGLAESAAERFPDARRQRCVVHWHRDVFGQGPSEKARAVAAMLKAIHAQEDRAAAEAKARDVVAKLRAAKPHKRRPSRWGRAWPRP
jgi:hypothetical protein